MRKLYVVRRRGALAEIICGVSFKKAVESWVGKECKETTYKIKSAYDYICLPKGIIAIYLFDHDKMHYFKICDGE